MQHLQQYTVLEPSFIQQHVPVMTQIGATQAVIPAMPEPVLTELQNGRRPGGKKKKNGGGAKGKTKNSEAIQSVSQSRDLINNEL